VWHSLSFAVQWRQRSIKIKIDGQTVEATLETGEPMVVTVGGDPQKVRPGGTIRVSARGP
jgi:trehalose/maltose hydrolase-like predicted phosphorylase